MLTGLTVEGLQMQKWNIPIDRAQRPDEKIRLFVELSYLIQ